MPSAAVKEYLRSNYPDFKESQIEALSKDVASIVIPKEMHRKVSETFGGRNKPEQIKADAQDLRAAVDRNLDAIKPALKEHDATDQQIEVAREKMHKINDSIGLYK
ncbi:hypothetical protein EYY98_03400 [Obesumbacterium proteus]|nr:hypothetical protein EYY98_03400 [Obesumbacterium proteus]